MSEETPGAIAAAPADPASAPPAADSPPQAGAQPTRRRAATLFGVVVLAALITALYVGWRWWSTDRGQHDAAADERRQLVQRVEALARGSEQARRETDTLRARLDDETKVNASLREQLLGLAERARLTEDALANLADKRLSGHDAML